MTMVKRARQPRDRRMGARWISARWIGARWLGAGVFGVAGLLAGLGALAVSGDPLDWRTVREVAPLALVLGALAGYRCFPAWPLGPAGYALSAAKAGGAVLALFVVLYLAGDGVIELAQGRGLMPALMDGAGRLLDRLPGALFMTILAFAGGGILLWLMRPRRSGINAA